MPEKNDIPIFRNLDGVYYRVVRDGIHVNRCFSDLSEAEQDVTKLIEMFSGFDGIKFVEEIM